PDTAVRRLDTACARVAMSQAAPPAAIEDHRREDEALGVDLEILGRELAIGQGDSARLETLKQRRETVHKELVELEERLKQERTLVDRIVDLRGKLEQAHQPPPAQDGKAPAAASA